MFDNIFLLKLLISFIISGSFAVFALWMSEKVGTKLGSIILSIPSTTAFSLLFIMWTQGVEVVTRAAVMSTASLGISFIFVIVFVNLLSRFKSFSLLISLFVWFISAVILSLFSLNIYSSSIIASILVVISFLFLGKIKPSKTKIKSTMNRTLLRFFLVGSIVSLVIVIAKLISPEWGGIFASFPAVYVATFYIAIKDYGVNFSKSIAANTVYAYLGFVSYPFAVYFLYPLYGIVLGTIGAYLVYLVVLYISNIIMSKKSHNLLIFL